MLNLLKKSWLGYGLLATLIAVFALLWLATGDLAGAILSLIVLVLGGGLAVAVLGYLFSNAPAWIRRLRGVSWDDYLLQLEKTGKALREEYEASRALTVEELHTSSLLHFIDIGDGKILCLFGQQYYDFEPITDDPEVNQPRLFPTTTFSLVRHHKRDEVISLVPGADVFEPTVCEPIIRPEKLYELGIELRNGEVISGVAFDDIERAIRAAK